jgi:hypothetical protein
MTLKLRSPVDGTSTRMADATYSGIVDRSASTRSQRPCTERRDAEGTYPVHQNPEHEAQECAQRDVSDRAKGDASCPD